MTRAVTATPERYVALLRGVNVGGANVIRMTDLKAAFEALGLRDVTTYIQSGNVLFRTRRSSPDRLAARIEKHLAELRVPTTVFLRSRRQMQDVVAGAPAGFGEDLAHYRCDVAFVKAPPSAADALGTIALREGVDEAYAGDGVIYLSRLIRRASESRLSRLASMPVYQRLTIRNWNTTTTLLRLLEEGA